MYYYISFYRSSLSLFCSYTKNFRLRPVRSLSPFSYRSCQLRYMIFYFLKELCRWTHPGHLYVFASLKGLTFHFVMLEIASNIFAFRRFVSGFAAFNFPAFRPSLFSRSFWDCKGRKPFLICKLYF